MDTKSIIGTICFLIILAVISHFMFGMGEVKTKGDEKHPDSFSCIQCGEDVEIPYEDTVFYCEHCGARYDMMNTGK